MKARHRGSVETKASSGVAPSGFRLVKLKAQREAGAGVNVAIAGFEANKTSLAGKNSPLKKIY